MSLARASGRSCISPAARWQTAVQKKGGEPCQVAPENRADSLQRFKTSVTSLTAGV
jgi:hypothetical protein